MRRFPHPNPLLRESRGTEFISGTAKIIATVSAFCEPSASEAEPG